MIVLRAGPEERTDAERAAVRTIERWNGCVAEVIEGQSLANVDYLLALPGGNEDLIARARRAGVRIVEVV